MKWTIFALLAFIIILMVVMYQNGKKYAQRQGERLIMEESNKSLKAERDSLQVEVYNSKQRNKQLEIKKSKIKIIYREIKTTIDTISNGGLDDRLLSSGFHPMLPCK